MSKKKLVPKLRFEEFKDDGEWEEKKLGDFGTVAMNKRIFKHQTSDSGDIPFFKIGTFGRKADSFISYELFNEYKLKYSYPKLGDILISASGSIGRTVEYKGEDEYFQDSNIVWLKHDARLSDLFLKHFYTIVEWSGLEGSTIKRLYNKNILNTQIVLPNIKEQEKIGEFLERLDNLINLQRDKLAKSKDIKSAYLSELFPKEGEKYPKMRFEGFTEAWKNIKLEKLFSQSGSGGTPRTTRNDYYNGDIPFLGIKDITKSDGNIYRTENNITNKGLDNSAAWIVPKESVSLAMYASVGKVAILKVDAATSQAFYNMVIENVATRDYVYQYLRKMKSDNMWDKIISTGTQANLNAEKVRNLIISIPGEIEEQQKIGNFFKKLDDQIELEEEKLEKLQKIKEAYLNDLFV